MNIGFCMFFIFIFVVVVWCVVFFCLYSYGSCMDNFVVGYDFFFVVVERLFVGFGVIECVNRVYVEGVVFVWGVDVICISVGVVLMVIVVV